MRIFIVGAGPAGLYLSILLKKTDPSHVVRVFERNAPTDTFGWGVVFSDETLGNLEGADPEVFRAIRRSFAYWDSIDIHYRGDVIRSVGHGFCGMSRLKLLDILRARAEGLGVEIEYEHEIDDIDALRAECDLFVAADGVDSRTREHLRDVLEPEIDLRSCRFMWLGTHQRFEALTFSFRQNADGVFQIHAYQFEEGLSTVIVECDEESWRKAGLDIASTEESIAYVEELFGEELGGHRLLDNHSSWRQFPTVRLASWHYENVVLIGDAAHTAHFSIGSGTKLAMEDAIALSAAIETRADLEAALDAYEEARRGDVGRTQKAAQQSLEWFEDVRRLWGFEPSQLMFSLLTRSSRITHENLRMRDPALVDAADRWYLEHLGQPVPPEGERPTPPMFTPFSLRGMTLKNRVVVSPMCQYSAKDGVPDEWHLVHLGSRALGGAGLVLTEMTDVSPEGRISLGCTGMWNDAQCHAWKKIVDFVHERSSAKIAVQLGHAGRKGSAKRLWEGSDEPLDEGGWEIIAPSAIAYKPASKLPRAMTRADMDRVRDQFVRSVSLAERAGFDMIELHMAHGYLLSSFLTPLANHRKDEYGGALAQRLRFPLEVFDAMRAAWPAHKPMSVRISATDWVEGGFTGEDAVIVARALREHSCDIIDVSTGQVHPDEEPICGCCYQTPFADRIRNLVGIPTLTVGNITTADQVNTILLAGRADLCALARSHIKDPYFTLHAAEELEHWDVDYPPQYLSAKPRPRKWSGDRSRPRADR